MTTLNLRRSITGLVALLAVAGATVEIAALESHHGSVAVTHADGTTPPPAPTPTPAPTSTDSPMNTIWG